MDLTNLLVKNGGPRVIEIYPNEYFKDNYFYFPRVGDAVVGDGFYFWYLAGDSVYDPPGGKGVYVLRQNGVSAGVSPRYPCQLLQADGKDDLMTGKNLGDAGDPFPGSTSNTVFAANTDPAARWADGSAAGIRIRAIELPPVDSRGPARVTMDWYDPTSPGPSDFDTDMDGLPDDWESSHALNPYKALGADGRYGDPDGDDRSNYQEYQAGTDPMDARSVLKMMGAGGVAGGGFELKWTSSPGKVYLIDRSTSLVDQVMAPFVSNIIATPPENTYTDATAIGSGPYFYRTVIQQ